MQIDSNEKDNYNRIVGGTDRMQYIKRTGDNEREQSIRRGR